MTNIKELIDGLVKNIKSLNVLRRKVEPSNAEKIKDIEVADIDRDKLSEFNADPLKVMITNSSEEIYLQKDITQLGPDKGLTDNQLAEINKTEDHNTVFKTDYLNAVGKFAVKYNETITDFSDKTADSISKVKELVKAFDSSEAFKTKYTEVVTDENKGSDHYDTYVLGKYGVTSDLLAEQNGVTNLILELPAKKTDDGYSIKPYAEIISEDKEKGFSDLFDLYKDKVVLDKPEERTLKAVLDDMSETKKTELSEMLLYKTALTKRANALEDSSISDLMREFQATYSIDTFRTLSDEDIETADANKLAIAINRFDHGSDDMQGTTGYSQLLKERIEDLIPMEENMVNPSKWEPLKQAIAADKEKAKAYRDKLVKAKEKADQEKTHDAEELVAKIKALYVSDGDTSVSKSHYETISTNGELEDSKQALTELVHAYFVLNTEIKKALEGHESDPIYAEANALVTTDKPEIGKLIQALRTHIAEKQQVDLSVSPYNVENTVVDKEAYTTAIAKLDELVSDIETTKAFLVDSTYHSEDDNNSSIPDDDGNSVKAKQALDNYKKTISSKKIAYNQTISEIEDADKYKKEIAAKFDNEEDVKAKLAADPYNADDIKKLLVNTDDADSTLVNKFDYLAYGITNENSYTYKTDSETEPTHTIYSAVEDARKAMLDKVKDYLNQARNLLVSKLVNLDDAQYKVGENPTSDDYNNAIEALNGIDTEGLKAFLDSTGTVNSDAIDTDGLDAAKKALKVISDAIAERVADYTKKKEAIDLKAAVDKVETPSIKGYKKDDDAALGEKISKVTESINALDEITIPAAPEEGDDLYAEARSAKTAKLGTLNGLKTKLTNEQSDDAKIATMVKNVTENIARVDGLVTGDLAEDHDGLSDLTVEPYTTRIGKLNDLANQYRRDVFDNDTENLTSAFNQLVESNPDGSGDDSDHDDYTKLMDLKAKVLEKVNGIKARVEKITADKAILEKALADEGVLKVANDDKVKLDAIKIEKAEGDSALKNLSPTEVNVEESPFAIIKADKTYNKVTDNTDRPVVTAINGVIDGVIADFNEKRAKYKEYDSTYLTPATDLEDDKKNSKLAEAEAKTIEAAKKAAGITKVDYSEEEKATLSSYYDTLEKKYLATIKANRDKDVESYVKLRTAVDEAEDTEQHLADKPKTHLGLLKAKYDGLMPGLAEESQIALAAITSKNVKEELATANLSEEYKGKTSEELATVLERLNHSKEAINTISSGIDALAHDEYTNKDYGEKYISVNSEIQEATKSIDNRIKEINEYKAKVVKLEALKLDEAGIEAAYPMPEAATGAEATAYDTRDTKLKELKTKLQDNGEDKNALKASMTETGIEDGDANYAKYNQILENGLTEYISKIDKAIEQNQKDKKQNVPSESVETEAGPAAARPGEPEAESRG